MRTRLLDAAHVFKLVTYKTCPEAKKNPKKKRQINKQKGWQYSIPHLSDAEEEDILESQPVQTEENAQIHHGLHTAGGFVPMLMLLLIRTGYIPKL